MRSSVRDGGISGLAGFSLVGLLLVLVGVAVVGLRPWAPASLIPSVAIAPDLETGIAESVALPPTPEASVADASAVRDKAPKIAAARRVSHAGDTGTGQAAPNEQKAVAVSIVSPAQKVAGPGSAPAPSQPEAPEPAAAPPPEPPPSAPAAPVVASVPEGGPRGPITAGGPEWGCSGDEYVLVISLVDEEADELSSQLEIRIEYFGSDGSRSEFSLEGDEEDVRELVALLSEQGDCVRVEEEPAAEEPVEPVEDEPEASIDTAAPGETLESESP